MNKVIGVFLMLLAPHSFADTSQQTETDKKTIDETKFCYYDNIEYSKGAFLVQAGKRMKCVAITESHFVYNSEQKELLVWVESLNQ